MAAPSSSVCAPWATIADVCSPCDDYTIDAALLEDSLAMASDILYVLSGSRYSGACTDIIRPNRCACLGPRTEGACGRCAWPYRIRLPRTPVVSITRVTVDGVNLSAARWRVDNYRDLVYVPESPSALVQHWPVIQYLERAVTEVGTWEVEYVAGVAPPPGGVRSAAILGCQLALACQPETLGDCQLPTGVTNVTRQGVTIALKDPSTLAELFAGGVTGLPVVDLWLGSEKARAKLRPSTVRVPGRRRGFTRTT